MSLYNNIFGVNPCALPLLVILNTQLKTIPRFRDCFLNEQHEIVIYTRTGGGNRKDYEDGNNALRQVPGFIADEDDSFDSTYAYFRYTVPEKFKDFIPELIKHGAVSNPAQRWKDLLEAMKTKDVSNPDLDRALTVGKQIMGEISKAFKEKDGGE